MKRSIIPLLFLSSWLSWSPSYHSTYPSYEKTVAQYTPEEGYLSEPLNKSEIPSSCGGHRCSCPSLWHDGHWVYYCDHRWVYWHHDCWHYYPYLYVHYYYGQPYIYRRPIRRIRQADDPSRPFRPVEGHTKGGSLDDRRPQRDRNKNQKPRPAKEKQIPDRNRYEPASSNQRPSSQTSQAKPSSFPKKK